MSASEREPDSFELLETMLWSAEAGFWLFDYHLERLQRSARYFGYPSDSNRIRDALGAHVKPLPPMQKWRIRLTLARDGAIAVTSSKFTMTQAGRGLPTVTISEKRTNSADIFLQHKTTNRRLYDTEFSRMQNDYGCAEVLFCNERGELTEGSRTNLFVQFGDVWCTPPLSCGLLDGTLRRSLLSQPHGRVKEAILTPHDLKSADEILIGNSVIGLREVCLVEITN